MLGEGFGWYFGEDVGAQGDEVEGMWSADHVPDWVPSRLSLAQLVLQCPMGWRNLSLVPRTSLFQLHALKNFVI